MTFAFISSSNSKVTIAKGSFYWIMRFAELPFRYNSSHVCTFVTFSIQKSIYWEMPINSCLCLFLWSRFTIWSDLRLPGFAHCKENCFEENYCFISNIDEKKYKSVWNDHAERNDLWYFCIFSCMRFIFRHLKKIISYNAYIGEKKEMPTRLHIQILRGNYNSFLAITEKSRWTIAGKLISDCCFDKAMWWLYSKKGVLIKSSPALEIK